MSIELILFSNDKCKILREKVLVVGKWQKIAYSYFPLNFPWSIIYSLPNTIYFSLDLFYSYGFEIPIPTHFRCITLIAGNGSLKRSEYWATQLNVYSQVQIFPKHETKTQINCRMQNLAAFSLWFLVGFFFFSMLQSLMKQCTSGYMQMQLLDGQTTPNPAVCPSYKESR